MKMNTMSKKVNYLIEVSKFQDFFKTVLPLMLLGCNTGSVKQPTINPSDTTQKIATDNSNETFKSPNIVKPVKYEILREPNGGAGVFDFMYIVYVPKSISNEEAKWIFDDLIRKKGEKIAIDIWNNKHAFYEELKIYQREDEIFDAGGDLKEFAKQRDRVTDKYDKHNIAQYSNNGVNVTMKLPSDPL